MSALLLIVLLYLASPVASLEIVIDNQGSGCMVDRPFREAIDKFHNGLRQRIAKGELEGYGPAREMYGLVYDCGLEEEARKEIKLPGYADLHHRGVTRFSGDYEGSAISALKEILETFSADKNSMRQVVYPKATRFGCSGRLRRNKKTGMRRMDWVCVYDKKPKDGESFEGGKPCNENKDCTYYKGSTCEWNLCYTFF
ncbi:SCP-like protein [Ancylostoma caninum]|uniref:SCP-like protein n=1 Tax=Ancylostoma caninum TaxID=29170 RepID=A0A368FUG3_ANCCA|nr:SCP-like protein [Ancylostoma caninum]